MPEDQEPKLNELSNSSDEQAETPTSDMTPKTPDSTEPSNSAEPAADMNAALALESEQPTNPEASAAPAAGSVFAAQNTAMPQPQKGGKKKWIIGGAIAAVIALVGGGSALAYTVYQSPEKVLTDGVVNAFSSIPNTAKANFVYKSKDGSFNIAVDGKRNDELTNGHITIKYEANSKTLEGSADFAAAISGDGYVKINDLDTLAKSAIDVLVESQVESYKSSGYALSEQQIAEMKDQMYNEYKPTIDKINNKWIKFAADKSDETSGKSQKCLADTMKKLKTDSKMRDELANAYKDNTFVIIKEKLGIKDGSYGFRLELDDKKAKSFGKAVEKTAFVKEVQKCIDPEAKNTDTSDDMAREDTSTSDDSLKNTVFELWVSQWSHQITAVSFSADVKDSEGASLKFDLAIDYKAATGLTTPTDSIDSKELFNDLMGSSTGSDVGAESLGASLLTDSLYSVR